MSFLTASSEGIAQDMTLGSSIVGHCRWLGVSHVHAMTFRSIVSGRSSVVHVSGVTSSIVGSYGIGELEKPSLEKEVIEDVCVPTRSDRW